jgi:hypothetical protein
MVADQAGLIFTAAHSIPRKTRNRRHLKGNHMRGLKVFLGSTVLLAGLALAPAANAQVFVNIGVPPVCSYGYYDYSPYACAPYGFYGPGYFYNGIFLGMGPWAGWGYGHGWGGHRFVNDGGGNYRGGGGAIANRSNYARGGGAAVRSTSVSRSAPTVSPAGGARPAAGHAAVQRSSGGGGQVRGGGGGGGQARGGGGGGGHAGGGGGGHEGGGGRK